MLTADPNEVVYTVIVEFDGNKAKSLYYRRLRDMYLPVRGDRDTSVLSRRSTADDRVIFQEGAIICGSEYLAHYIAGLAQDCGAVNVAIVTGKINVSFVRSRKDAEIMNRIDEKASKRGRKPEARPWVCTCLECLRQTQQTVPYVINCGHCGGLNVGAREGTLSRYADPGGELLTAWAATRFAGGAWEPTEINPNASLPPTSITIKNTHGFQATTVKAMAGSTHLDTLRQMERENAFAFLDAIFVAYAFDKPEQRAERRVRVITEYMMRGGDVTKISFAEPDAPDIIDAAALGVSKVVGWMMKK